jgi:hypothetical protein
LKPFSPGSSKSNKIISTSELPDSKVSITFRPLFTAVTTCHIRWNDKLPAWKRRKIANRAGKKGIQRKQHDMSMTETTSVIRASTENAFSQVIAGSRIFGVCMFFRIFHLSSITFTTHMIEQKKP